MKTQLVQAPLGEELVGKLVGALEVKDCEQRSKFDNLELATFDH